MEKMKESALYIKNKIGEGIDTALILGSGLGDLGEQIQNSINLPYETIPHFPQSTAPGHAGRLVAGELAGKKVLVMQGRFHFYEGYDMQTVVYPIRVFKLLGIKKLIVTNAAGGVNTSFNPGDLMLITDHIKLAGDHPLIGPNLDEFGPRFNDMSDAYSKELIPVVKSAAKKAGIPLQEGVYTYFTGPSFETPAEIRMVRVLGGDAVGMSTVPEVITCAHSGIKVIGISCISNMAAGILDQPITSEEVIETGKMVADRFSKLIQSILKEI